MGAPAAVKTRGVGAVVTCTLAPGRRESLLEKRRRGGKLVLGCSLVGDAKWRERERELDCAKVIC